MGQSIQFSGISASTIPFVIEGGRYGVGVMGSNFGTVKLQQLALDGTTYLDLKAGYEKADGTGGTEDDLVIGTFAANGYKVFDLAPGKYRITIGSATAVSVAITRVPLSGS
jgi:hypothetical protein